MDAPAENHFYVVKALPKFVPYLPAARTWNAKAEQKPKRSTKCQHQKIKTARMLA